MRYPTGASASTPMVAPEYFSPAAGFDDPVEIWLACHERVLRFCSLMHRLNDHVGTEGANADARVTANSIRRYFNEAAPRHHEDEEVDLFPRLRARLRSDELATLAPTLASIEEDHATTAELWKAMDERLARIEAGERALLDPALVDRWTALYQHHIQAEEQVILPALRRALTAADWKAAGHAMAARRGVIWPPEQPAAARKSVVPIKARK